MTRDVRLVISEMIEIIDEFEGTSNMRIMPAFKRTGS